MVANNAVRYWPWIMVGLVSLVVFPVMPEGMTEEAAYPLVMLKVLGPGLLGLLLVSFFAAFMSTIDTHLNWGASYLVNDIYRRFLKPDATEKQLVVVAKLCVLAMMVCAVVVAFFLTSIGKAWLFVWAMGAGIGPVLILRWFWWRINAWSEIAALAASVVLAVGFEVTAAVQTGSAYELFATPVRWGGMALETHHKALILVPVTILVWLTVTLLTRPVDRRTPGPFYRRCARAAAGGRWLEGLPGCALRRLVSRAGWCVGWPAVRGVFGLIFGLGKLVLGEPLAATALLAMAVVCAVPVARELRSS